MSSAQQWREPLVKYSGDPMDAAYQEERLAWRKSLSDMDVRSLAYDYKCGLQDECNADAMEEYLLRFGEGSNGPRQEFTSRTRKARPSKSPRRRRKAA